MPHQFRNLSSRLVTQNGVLLMAGAAVVVLLITGGSVSVLVVLYSINRVPDIHAIADRIGALLVVAPGRRPLADPDSTVAARLDRLWRNLVVTTIEKFSEGGWVTLIITGLVVAIGVGIRRHYRSVAETRRTGGELTIARPRDTSRPCRSSCPGVRRRHSSSARIDVD